MNNTKRVIRIDQVGHMVFVDNYIHEGQLMHFHFDCPHPDCQDMDTKVLPCVREHIMGTFGPDTFVVNYITGPFRHDRVCSVNVHVFRHELLPGLDAARNYREPLYILKKDLKTNNVVDCTQEDMNTLRKHIHEMRRRYGNPGHDDNHDSSSSGVDGGCVVS